MPVRASTNRVTAADAATDTGDLDLVRRAQAGDSAAFGELVERHRRSVFRTAVAALGSAAEADDVSQEAFVTAFRKLDGFRGEASFKTWLLTITWRKALDRRQSLLRWVRRVAAPRGGEAGEEVDPIERVPDGAWSQEEALMTAQLQGRLRSLIATLPRRLRDPLLLAGSGEYSYEDIGHVLKIPVGTVKWRVSEARRMLKQKLQATEPVR